MSDDFEVDFGDDTPPGADIDDEDFELDFGDGEDEEDSEADSDGS